MLAADADHAPSDDQILSWWNQAHDEHGVTVSSEMVTAYTRQVVYADKLAWFDAQLAALLTPSERAYLAQRFPLPAPPSDGPGAS